MARLEGRGTTRSGLLAKGKQCLLLPPLRSLTLGLRAPSNRGLFLFRGFHTSRPWLLFGLAERDSSRPAQLERQPERTLLQPTSFRAPGGVLVQSRRHIGG